MFIEDFSDNSGFIVTKDTIIHSWPLQRNDPVEHWDVIQEILQKDWLTIMECLGFSQ